MEIKQISDKDYHGINKLECFSVSGGGKLSKHYTPRHFKADSFKGSSETNIGTAVHAHFLNEKWDEEIAVYKDHKTVGVKARPFIELNKGKVVISQHEADVAKVIYDAQDEHIKKFFFRKTQNEFAIVGIREGVPVKCKPDAYSENLKILYDIKTTSKSFDKWKDSIYDMGYHKQAAFYTDMATEAGLDVDKFVFLVIETKAPYCHKFVDISMEVLQDGREDIEEAFQIYKQCYLNNNWEQGYSEDIYTIQRPYWRRKAARDPSLDFR